MFNFIMCTSLFFHAHVLCGALFHDSISLGLDCTTRYHSGHRVIENKYSGNDDRVVSVSSSLLHTQVTQVFIPASSRWQFVPVFSHQPGNSALDLFSNNNPEFLHLTCLNHFRTITHSSKILSVATNLQTWHPTGFPIGLSTLHLFLFASLTERTVFEWHWL